MNKPKVSVIVPVYNVAKYLRKCLDSILNQTFQDFEIILISDGPEDDDKICEEYLNTYNKITLIKDINKGLGGARNAGIDIAKGEFLVFIDSDDWIEPEYLEKMYNAIIADKDIDIVQCGTNIVFEDKINEKLKSDDEKYFKINFTGKVSLDNDIFGNMNVASWNKLYKKELIQKYKIRFPENLKNEDAYFTWAYWSICRNMFCIQEKLYNYLRRDGSLMAQTLTKNMGAQVLDHLTVGEMFYNFLNENNLFEQRKEAFFNAYFICWLFVKRNASEKYKKIGHEITRKFLKNKIIPAKHDMLIKIAKNSYENFHRKNSLPENIFSIKNSPEKTHKVITLCGLKIKIKRKLHKYYEILGKNNIVLIIDENGKQRKLKYCEKIAGLQIRIIGSNNTIIIEQPSVFKDAYINMEYSYNSFLNIKKTPNFMWTVKLANGINQQFLFGENSSTSWYGQVHILDSNAGVKIGNDCMISGNIMIFASDAHTIYSIENKKVLNKVTSHVVIDDNCWIAHSAKFLKNARIAKNCIVANSAIVTKEFKEENVILAGNPAKIVKRNVNWDIRSAEQFMREENINV